jgi:membrane glycosyltransferase
MEHCELPTLGKGALIPGHVLSHDQVEAVLMRRAGYEVRVLPEEGASFEQNPPTLTEFIGRDLRWCQGNMQYWHFLFIPGLKFISRYQLVFALLMFVSSPAWIALLVFGTAAVALAGSGEAVIRADLGIALFAVVFAMWFAPLYATAIDVLRRRPLLHGFGGPARFVAGIALTTAFLALVVPIMWFAHTMFLVRLMLGRPIGWTAQLRDDHSVPWLAAARQLWPHTLLGLVTIGTLAVVAPAGIPFAMFIGGGPLLSIPLAVITASPRTGRALVGLGIGRLPEETAPPPELKALGLPTLRSPAGRGA